MKALRFSPWLRQTVKTLFAVRCKFIVPHPGAVLECAGEAETGNAGEQPDSRNSRPELIADDKQGAVLFHSVITV